MKNAGRKVIAGPLGGPVLQPSRGIQQTAKANPRAANRAEMLDDLPGSITVVCGFEQIEVQPSTANPHGPAWAALMSLPIENIGQEVFLNKVVIEQLPPDDGTYANHAAGPGVSWGNTPKGTSAVIVIGDHLPIQAPNVDDPWYTVANAWTLAPCQAIGVNSKDLSQFAATRADRSYFCPPLSFPPGKYTDVPFPFKRVTTFSFGATGRRLGLNQRLDVALVLGKGTLNDGGEGSNVFGFCSVALTLMTTKNVEQFNDR